MYKSKSGGLVWIISGVGLLTYGTTGLLVDSIPGLEQLVTLISNTEGSFIFAAAFLAILIEGLYMVGSFFPGSTIIIISAILSQLGGTGLFLGVIGSIYIGWIVAGMINIALAYTYRSRITHTIPKTDHPVTDQFWLTWFPAFRANHEVAQVIEGAHPLRVLASSVRVKTIASALAAVGTLILPHIIDVQEMSNEEGFSSLVVIASIMLGVGVWKQRQSKKT